MMMSKRGHLSREFEGFCLSMSGGELAVGCIEFAFEGMEWSNEQVQSLRI